jgi:crotonobetainyl-CoA:carnitine CoA-transferase CaiB-like acyl-CoA transferase
MAKEGVPCGPVRTYEEALADPHSRARQLVVSVNHPLHGEMKTVRNPVVMDHDGPEIKCAAPLLGQHSVEILDLIGIDGGALDQLIKSGVTFVPALTQPSETAK